MTTVENAGTAPLTEVLDLLSERIARYRFDDQIIVYCNKAWAMANGGEPADFVGRPLYEMLGPLEREGLADQLTRLGPETPFLKDHMTRTGGDRWIEWTDLYVPGPPPPHAWSTSCPSRSPSMVPPSSAESASVP